MSLLMRQRFAASSFLSKGISKLSELTVDADKDCNGVGLSNLKELAAGMQKGDITIRGAGGVLIKISPGPVGHELTAHGSGHEISWEPPPVP